MRKGSWRTGMAATSSIFGKSGRIAGLAVLLAASLIGAAVAQPGERRVTFLTVNDIYRIDGVAEGKSGGLARLRTLRSWIERDAPDAILLHAGDFLSPSLVGKVFKGEQMIDAMNNLHGDPKAFDTRMFVAFGNHEFDDSKCSNAASPLDKRVAESQFTWLVSNLDFSGCASMSGVPKRQNVKDTVIVDVANVKVGLFGIALTPDKESAPRYPRFEEGLPAARRSIAALRAQGAELIVALTHLPREDDEALLRELDPAGLDLLVGGHDHNNMVLMDGEGHPRGFKADSDGRTAWRIDVSLAAGQRPRIEAQLITLNEAIPADEPMTKLAAFWAARADEELCGKRIDGQGKPASPLCMEEQIGRTQSVIELEETANRSQETGFGDWLADAVKKDTGADVTIINSGILGLNEDLAAGTKLRLRHVADAIRFDDIVAVRAFPAKQVCAAIAHGLLRPGMGAWPHLAGVTAEVKRADNKYTAAAVTGFVGKKGVSCKSNTPIKVAAPPFLLCGGDGYPLLKPSDTCIADLQKAPLPAGVTHKPRKLSEIAETAIRAAGQAGIKPDKDGRLRFQ
ncbi:bifunctional metallophosphatase/5'-nucleotidase [Microbacteriaceae bacterium K1510]|nr:bifunctional metallophosphatase/5'-nucleotidase [Microbacteriaceae bacterium K1510]